MFLLVLNGPVPEMVRLVGKDPRLVKRFVCAVRGDVYAEGEDEGKEDEDEG
jgi:hypothetical protein